MRKICLVLAALAMAGPAAAETGRYQFRDSADGILRLDTQTGAVALCTGQPLSCRETGTPEASSAEVKRLEERVAALEQRLAALEQARGGTAESLPSEEEFDRTLSLMERFMRRFFGVIQEFDAGREPRPSPPQPAPDRT